ncbi:MAG: hypothetical protein A3H97_23610 [Acidobacteria bacterium RIFCSPLOWO2_02_FULL_65_29]|nr:MAG: hypothetical protein A3H97_23610 [Acidobacteria bacterium RIFCSPLOWO2_02_FULL_65_29]
MRDLFAGLVALALLVAALSLATTLHAWRRRRQRLHDAERALGRVIVAEIPVGDELKLFSEDADRFYYGERAIEKASIAAARVLINGSPIAAVVSARHPREAERHPTSFDDRPEGIARDRWDVAIEAVWGTVLVECGAIRERISQELARAVFDAVRRDVERRNATAS